MEKEPTDFEQQAILEQIKKENELLIKQQEGH